jgi:hypothetical protein
VQGDSIYRGLPGLPQDNLNRLEDPVIWSSGGWYHILVNNWGDRRAYHIISRDGITGWKFQGLAYERVPISSDTPTGPSTIGTNWSDPVF